MAFYDGRLAYNRPGPSPNSAPAADPYPSNPIRPAYSQYPSHYSQPDSDYEPSAQYRAPMIQYQATPSRPSFQSDYYDDKSFSSTTHLASPQKEWDIGSVVPQEPQLYPPRPSPLPTPTYTGTSHWHQMRDQLLERRVIQQIPLHNGNLVLDVPVPKGVIPSTTGLSAQPEEMTSMRYTAATCDPDVFMARKYTLRPYLYNRGTELFVSSDREFADGRSS